MAARARPRREQHQQEDVDSICFVDDPRRVVEIVCVFHDKPMVSDGDEDEEPPPAKALQRD